MKRFLFGTLAGCLLLPLALAAPDPRQPAADLPILAKDNNAFAFDLYAKLRAKEGNLFLSPSSVSTALAMTYVGARGRTAEQMAKTLHFDLPPDRLHPAFAALVGHLNGEGVDPK